MKKIKRFRIKIRPSYVERLLRRNGKISGVTKEDIDRHISESQRLLDPCTVYDTYKPDDVVRKGFAVTDKSVVGVSLIVVTIGERLAKEITRLKKGKDEKGAAVLDAIGTEAVEQSVNFVSKLIMDEAEEQECAVSLPEKISTEHEQVAVDMLDAEKIGVKVDNRARLIPEETMVVLASWTRSKRRK